MNCENCSKYGSCPFAFSEESEMIQNYGCLPSNIEIVTMRVHYGKTWACHSNPTKPCVGAIEFLKKYNLPFNVIDKKLITENDDWSPYIEKEKFDETIKYLNKIRSKRFIE